MEAVKVYEVVLLLLLIGCAVSVNFTKSLLHAVIVFMAYSSIMCVLWILMESPDLAITEAAVGAGVSGILFLVTLKKLREMGADREGAGVPAPDGGSVPVPESVPDGAAPGNVPVSENVPAPESVPDGGTEEGGGPA